MAVDCPRCGLVNPPTAQRCDCGYDFTGRRFAGTHLSEQDLARQSDARLPIYVPTGCTSLILLLAISGTNAIGVSLVVLSTMDAMLFGAIIGNQTWVYLTVFGVSATAVDLGARLYFRCSMIDLKRGSRFFWVPVWGIGFFSIIMGLSALIAAYT